MRVGALTCTGGRPQAFALCEQFVARQTRPVDRWVIVDDVEEPTRVTVDVDHDIIRPTPFWEPGGEITLGRNMIAGLEALDDVDVVVVFEDDDYYSPRWVKVALSELEGSPEVELVGEGFTLYYHAVVNHWFRNTNNLHASLCATVFRSSIVPDVIEAIQEDMTNPWIDHKVWMKFGATRGRVLMSDYVVGMKGLPGRGGAGKAHDPQRILTQWPMNDWDFQLLGTLIGDDVELYRDFSDGWQAEDEEIRRMLRPQMTPNCGMPRNMMDERAKVIDAMIRARAAKRRGMKWN